MTDPLDDLYAAPLSDFTAVRNRIASELKDAGDDAGAARVKVLKKPPVTVWVINQLARGASDDLEALLAASVALEAALDGGEDVAAPTAARRTALAVLRKKATKVLEGAGHNAGQAQL